MRLKNFAVAGMLALAVIAITSCGSSSQTETKDKEEITAEKTEVAEVTESNEENESFEEAVSGEITEVTDKMTLPERIKKTIEDGQDPTAAVRVNNEDEYYIFELSDSVEREHVYYRTRYGIELAGDLYYAKDMDKTKQYPALVVGPPFGGVKEQGPGVYANELAKRGFVVLAFDPAYHGFSGGMPRYTASTEMYVEDFSAGVDYLGLLSYVDREQIGAIGICGSGGFVLGAAAQDTRIKAVATSAMYDITGMGDGMTSEERNDTISGMCAQRWMDAETGDTALGLQYSPEAPLDELPSDLEGTAIEWNTFYSLKRGWHPNAYANVTNTSMLSLFSYAALTHMQEISPRPILFITGDIAHSRGMSENFYERAAEPKELYIVEGAMHIDLYDDTDLIPFDKLENFFKEAFAE